MFWYGLCGPQGGSCGGSGALAEAGTLIISGTVLWFILALIVAAVEMVTGTVYLLAVTLACAAAGAASWQFAVCALVTVIGCALAHLLRRRKNPQADRLMNLDEGERIRVESVGTGGTAVVQYRGAPWIACAEEGDLTPGTWIIARVDGTRLVLRSAALK